MHACDDNGGYQVSFKVIRHPLSYLPARGWEDDGELGRYLVLNAAPLHVPDSLPSDEQWWHADCVHAFTDAAGAHWVEIRYPEIAGCPRANMRVSGKHGIRRYLPPTPMEDAIQRPLTWIHEKDCTVAEWHAFQAQRHQFHHPQAETTPGPQPDVEVTQNPQPTQGKGPGQGTILSYGSLTSVHSVQEAIPNSDFCDTLCPNFSN